MDAVPKPADMEGMAPICGGQSPPSRGGDQVEGLRAIDPVARQEDLPTVDTVTWQSSFLTVDAVTWQSGLLTTGS